MSEFLREVGPEIGPEEGDPTPEEIALACQQIRAGWSEEEKSLRRNGLVPELYAPFGKKFLRGA